MRWRADEGTVCAYCVCVFVSLLKMCLCLGVWQCLCQGCARAACDVSPSLNLAPAPRASAYLARDVLLPPPRDALPLLRRERHKVRARLQVLKPRRDRVEGVADEVDAAARLKELGRNDRYAAL